MQDDELERFKNQVSIVDIACQDFGYEIDKAKSSKSYYVLKNGKDCVVVTRNSAGHDRYFAASDADSEVKNPDRGDVINFVKMRVNDNNAKLVRVRQALRPWVTGAKKPSPRMPKIVTRPVISKGRDEAELLAEYQSFNAYSGKYLADRGLSLEVVSAFGVRQDERGNAVFAHTSNDGTITGWEQKSKNWKHFLEGGTQSLFKKRLENLPVSRVVVCESAIDCLSYAQIKHQLGTAYVSISGTPTERQLEQLKDILDKSGAQLVIAVDKDAGGKAHAQKLMALVDKSKVEFDLPTNKDWNDDLFAIIAAKVAAEDDGDSGSGYRYDDDDHYYNSQRASMSSHSAEFDDDGSNDQSWYERY